MNGDADRRHCVRVYRPLIDLKGVVQSRSLPYKILARRDVSAGQLITSITGCFARPSRTSIRLRDAIAGFAGILIIFISQRDVDLHQTPSNLRNKQYLNGNSENVSLIKSQRPTMEISLSRSTLSIDVRSRILTNNRISTVVQYPSKDVRGAFNQAGAEGE